MTYRVSYADGWTPSSSSPSSEPIRTEYFWTEHEALARARELVESGVHHRVSLSDSSGSVIAGVHLQFKVGTPVHE